MDEDLAVRVNQGLGHIDNIVDSLREAQPNMDGMLLSSRPQLLPVSIPNRNGVFRIIGCPFLDPGLIVAAGIAKIFTQALVFHHSSSHTRVPALTYVRN